jgi:hypothetical protein
LNGGPTSILTPLLDNIAHSDTYVLVVLARVRLRGLTPASIEQRLSGGHTGRRGGGLGAADACQRADGQCGLCPRQRSNICCRLAHLGSFALHQLVHIFARLIDVAAQGRDGLAEGLEHFLARLFGLGVWERDGFILDIRSMPLNVNAKAP